MDIDTKKIHCDDDGEYIIYCHVCDNLAIDRYYNNHLKSQTHINNFCKRQQIINTNNLTSSQHYYYKSIPELYFQFHLYNIIYHQIKIM